MLENPLIQTTWPSEKPLILPSNSKSNYLEQPLNVTTCTPAVVLSVPFGTGFYWMELRMCFPRSKKTKSWSINWDTLLKQNINTNQPITDKKKQTGHLQSHNTAALQSQTFPVGRIRDHVREQIILTINRFLVGPSCCEIFLIIFINNGSLNFKARFISIFKPFPEKKNT